MHVQVRADNGKDRDAEIVALVEINPLSVLSRFEQRLAQRGVTYQSVVVPQASGLHIGVLFKEGCRSKIRDCSRAPTWGTRGKERRLWWK